MNSLLAASLLSGQNTLTPHMHFLRHLWSYVKLFFFLFSSHTIANERLDAIYHVARPVPRVV